MRDAPPGQELQDQAILGHACRPTGQHTKPERVRSGFKSVRIQENAIALSEAKQTLYTVNMVVGGLALQTCRVWIKI